MIKEKDFYYRIEEIFKKDNFDISDHNINDIFEKQIVMITGAGGSIGSELAKKIIKYSPRKLILIDRSEAALFIIEQELINLSSNVEIIASTVNICDEFLLSNIYRHYKPDLIFHTAAHKHVSLMEKQPAEAIYNNVIGTEIAARLAIEYGVKKFIFVSTDKAVNPISIMGASKRLAEMILLGKENDKCAFSIVRFGNIIGSSGSVLSIFYKQLCLGGPLTVAHSEATRYFMSISEAIGLIIQSTLYSKGGEVFIFDMGYPIKIIDIAYEAVKIFNLEPYKDIDITYTGLKKGEKLHEEAIHKIENIKNSKHDKIFLLENKKNTINVSIIINDFISNFYNLSKSDYELKLWLGRHVPEYIIG